MRSALVLGFSLMVLGAPAAAQDAGPLRSAYLEGSLNLIAGERVVLIRGGDGGFAQSAGDRVAMEDVLPPAEAKPEDLRGLVTTAPGTVSFALQLRQDVGSLLRVENATGKGLKYVAYIRRVSGGEVSEPARTSVCTVPAGLVAFEHWPDPVVQVIAAGFEDAEGDAPVCESHVVNE